MDSSRSTHNETLPGIMADTPRTRCAFYRIICGLDARVQSDFERIVVTVGGDLGAVSAPTELAARTKVQLLRGGVRIGPIVSHLRSSQWTFLVCPHTTIDKALHATLFRERVSVCAAGSQVALPAPVRRHLGFRCWAVAPTDTYRPASTVVVAAVAEWIGLEFQATLRRPSVVTP